MGILACGAGVFTDGHDNLFIPKLKGKKREKVGVRGKGGN